MRLSLLILLQFLLLLALLPLRSQAETSIDARLGVEGSVLAKPTGASREQEAWLAGAVGGEITPERRRNFKFKLKVVGEFLVTEPDGIGLNRTGSPNFLEDEEAYVEYRRGEFRASAGSKILRWGLVDFFDPLDQLNSRRLERPLRAQKRGEWMGWFSWERTSRRGSWGIEGFVVPERRESLLPSVRSPWLPRQLYVPNLPQAEFELPGSLEYRYLPSTERDEARHWNGGARLLWRPGTSELSLQWDQGASGLPALQPTVTGTVVALSPRTRIRADSLIELREVYYREQHYGATLVQPLPGDFLLRTQIAKTEPLASGRTLARDRADAALAVEKNLGLPGWGSLTIIAQGFRNWLADDSGGNDIASFSTLFDRAIAAGLRWAPSETSSISAGALHSLSATGATVYLASAAWDLSDSLALAFDWTIFSAPPESAIGPFDGNDGGSLSLTSTF